MILCRSLALTSATRCVQTETSNEHHDDVLKEKDRQIDQLRGQLQVAVAEADETLQELKTVTSDFSAEKLTLQKKVVELEAQMKLVEANMEEWKQKALESSAQVRSVTRQLKLKVRLQSHNLDRSS